MGFPISPFKEVEKFEWKDLNKRFFQVCYIPANPEVLEPLEQVFLIDKDHNMYLVYERNVLTETQV